MKYKTKKKAYLEEKVGWHPNKRQKFAYVWQISDFFVENKGIFAVK